LNGKNILQINSYAQHTCVIANDYNSYCWGNNDNGQIGDGTTIKRAIAVAVNTTKILNGKLIHKIETGGQFTCAIYSSSKSCFFIEFNDSKVCSGNGKKLKK
jgi:alpha-tubulin suppressor-like RCC1 family protein